MVNDKSAEYKQKLQRLLLRKARGYPYTEKTDEFVVVDGEVTLAKRKVVTKRVQPDAEALQTLMSLSDNDVDLTELTDKQLQEEKMRLIALLAEQEKECGNHAQTEFEAKNRADKAAKGDADNGANVVDNVAKGNADNIEKGSVDNTANAAVNTGDGKPTKRQQSGKSSRKQGGNNDISHQHQG